MLKSAQTGTSMRATLLLDSDKVMARQPIRKLILVHKLRSFNALKKHRKTSASRGTKIMSKNSIFINETTYKARRGRASSRIISILIPYLLYFPGLSFPSYAAGIVVVVTVLTALYVKLSRDHRCRKWLKNRFKGLKFDKDKPEPEEFSNESRKRSSADLLWTLDANTFENFVLSMSVLLAWWLLSRLISLVRRFYYKVVRK